MGTKISSMLLVITLDDINVSLRDASSSIWDGIRFLVQSFKPALDLLLSHNELLLPAIILLYFVIRSSRMIFLYLLQLIEFSVRLLRFLGNLISELFWINPRYRLKRAKRYESQANFSLLAIFLRFVEEIFSLPIDWVCSLGIKGVFAPDPFTESKNYIKTAFFPSLRERLSIVGNNHITIYFFLSLIRLFVHRLTLPSWLPLASINEFSHGDQFPIKRQLHLFKRHDVEEILERSEDFQVIYGPRMCDVTQNGRSSGNFLLGMQASSPTYTRDISNMRLIFRREDMDRCQKIAANASIDSFLAFAARDDVIHDLDEAEVLSLPNDLVIPVIKAFIEKYFGVRLPLEATNADGTRSVDFNLLWFSHLFHYIFYDLNGDDSREGALESARLLNQDLDLQISNAKQLPRAVLERSDTVLSRCLLLQESGTPGMDDLAIRINLTGFLVGAVLPLINTICQVVDQLLSRPRILKQAAIAADHPDWRLMQGFVLEALRFSPGDPVIYRHCKSKTELLGASHRTSVSENTLVMAWNSSAMFDPKYVDQPWRFNPNRPIHNYLHFGHMHHVCAGKYIVMSVIPALVRELLSRYELARIPGKCGYPMKNGITVSDFDILVRRRPDPQHPGKSMTSTSI